MHSAILYTRVSTEEQANKGYSLKHQEDILTQYCNLRNIVIQKIFTEDHSAKSFNRPAWKKLMTEIQGVKKPPDFILFTKWDRFSRNTGDSYSMIRILQKLSVEPQAIEQPLDLSVPENKMMLAFYLAVPEVENDRRGLNIKYGMLKAREEGRLLGRAPIGYTNQCAADGSKFITTKEPEASIMKYAFEHLASERLNMNHAYLKAVKYGLKCSRSHFWTLMHNPVYAGYIQIPASDKNKACLVPGQHQGIISLSLFEKVQALIYNKKREEPNSKSFNIELFLKGFINCPRCSKTLTGSGSTGRKGVKYYYYHCSSLCRFRIKAMYVHDVFLQTMKRLSPGQAYIELYRSILKELYKQEQTEILIKLKKAIKGIELFSDRIQKAKNLLLDSYINFEDYNRIKTDLQEKIQLLESSITFYHNSQITTSHQLELSVEEFRCPYSFFNSLSNELKQDFVNNLFTKGWRWNEVDFESILKKSAHTVYELSSIEDSKNKDPETDEVNLYLKKFAKIALMKDKRL